MLLSRLFFMPFPDNAIRRFPQHTACAIFPFMEPDSCGILFLAWVKAILR